jgi:hypothetical protein
MTVRRTGIVLALACGTVLLPAAPAVAQEPEKTGWWNRLSAGPAALPQPTTSEGDLRIANAPDGPAAYAAVLYAAPGATGATLDLEVRADSVLGTPEIAACPTESADWAEGGNQPFSAAPPYDCDRGLAFGSVSEDGTTLSFVLDESTQLEPGTWSLALVPQPRSSSGPFALDVAKPAAGAFVVTATSETGPLLADEPAPTTSTGDSGSGEAFLPGFDAAPSFDTGSSDVPPLVAGGDALPALPQTQTPGPAVASQAPVNPPVLLATPAGVVEDLGTGRRLLGLLVLAGGSAAVGYAAGQQRSAPRLLGGRARVVGAGALATEPVVPAGEDRPRGIGRFARTRDTAPRRLR